MEYTKEKWEKEGNCIYALTEIRDSKLANRFECFVSSGSRLAPQEEIEANAQLMAAAPDMYEALKMWLDSPVTTPEIYERAIELGKQALTKAEGKEV